MRPVQPKDVDRHRCIFLFDDEPLLNLAIALQNEQHAQEWWHVVVDMEGGGYAVGRIADLTAALDRGGEEALQKPMGAFVGDALIPASVIVDIHEADMDTLREDAYASASQVAVILEEGEFRGIIPVGGTRSGGLFDSGLVTMAGQYGDIPKEGLLSPRRKSSKKTKSKKKK